MEYVAIQGLDESAFYARLEDAIISFRPSICIVHAGFVFHDFTTQFMAVIKQLKASRPSLRFAIQPYALPVLSKPQADLFEMGEDVDELLSIFF